MKKVLIISPYFVPSNTPDSQRIRMSLPYFKAFGWQAELVCVEDQFSEFRKDELLWKSIPNDTLIHYVKAFSKKWTSKIGLGSLALRSLYHYRKKVDDLLKKQHYDLIYFSTTQFPVCILGAYWKKKFGVPYVIDMQDPWHTDYYEDKPKHQRPPKYWFSYRLNKWLEPLAMRKVDGLISVSQTYLNDLTLRYPNLKNIPQQVITFAYAELDLQIAKQLTLNAKEKPTLTYIGVLGVMMNKGLNLLFNALATEPALFANYNIAFKGTSYAPAHLAKKTATPIAEKYKLNNVTENTDRLSMFKVLAQLNDADGLLIVGTDDPGYTASKLYPYLQVNKPILAILHPESNANKILIETSNAIIIYLDDLPAVVLKKLKQFDNMVTTNNYTVNHNVLRKYNAETMANIQTNFFNSVLNNKQHGL